MALTTVRPTGLDVAIANEIASRTRPGAEEAAEALTWGADEHILCALAAGWWLYARNKDEETRFASDHILLTTVVASALPHLLKTLFNQERPDRLTIRGHWRGVPFSGNRLDAFPSGHAVHIGALASAASVLPARRRNAVWGIGLGLVLTRIVLLAHWASDVAVGLGVGVLTERILRPFTSYGRRSMAVPSHANPIAPAMIPAKPEAKTPARQTPRSGVSSGFTPLRTAHADHTRKC